MCARGRAGETRRGRADTHSPSADAALCRTHSAFAIIVGTDANTPHWLSEGIATLFESSPRGEVRDPGGANPERPAALREYMAVVRGRPAGEGTKIDGAMRLRDFRAAFGDDLANVERSLSAYVDGL